MSGIGSHTSPNKGARDEWLTPPEIIEALGPFDLDPCSPVERPWPPAAHHMTEQDNGLWTPWDDYGLVWLNPPYGPQTWSWLAKLSTHPAGGIALIFARTETDGFVQTVWHRADALVFLDGRIVFHHVDGSRASGNSGGPSVLVAYGARAFNRLRHAPIAGSFVSGWGVTP